MKISLHDPPGKTNFFLTRDVSARGHRRAFNLLYIYRDNCYGFFQYTYYWDPYMELDLE